MCRFFVEYFDLNNNSIRYKSLRYWFYVNGR